MNERFETALAKVLEFHTREGIGTLSEGTLHAVIKNYLDSDESHHERKYLRFFCDVYDGDHIYEIQTRQLFKLGRKLTVFLPEKRVTVVFPISGQKNVFWIDQATGEFSGGRKSPRSGRATDVLPELYGIVDYLNEPNIDILVLLFRMDEYRNLNGWGRGGKRGSSRYDRIPRELTNEVHLKTADDYRAILPNDLPQTFSAKEFSKFVKLSIGASYGALKVLEKVGVVTISKEGRLNSYSLNPTRI